ncbi:MAG: short-chain dehydrogenase [Bacteroidetes bacterium CG12_big_fil_rev_8_21_14_0_65_60_17]|nr:MAG: short-chain dehydrogenase [Bacteroidetes bacterium CG12_big_fil_rev_8_21_14_0_65_60_17]
MQHEKTIWITGATGGIGRELTHRLANAGHRLVLSARTADPLTDLATTYGATALPLNASDFKWTMDLAREASREGLHAVVHLPGSILLRPEHLTSEADFDAVISQNLKTAFSVVRAASKVMYKTGGRIVLVSTAAASIGMKNHGAIAAAKAGIEGLMRSAAASYASRGICVNAVAPGMVETPLSEPILSNKQNREFSEAMHPLGRVGQPSDVVSAIAWLLQDDAGWVTGAVIPVDGGLATVLPR